MSNSKFMIGRFAVLVGLVPTVALAQSSFTPLGDLPGGDAFSSANGVSSFDAAAGSVANLVVVGNARSANDREAFRWTAAGGMVGLGDLGGAFFFSFASSVNADGTMVAGGGAAPSGTLAYRWQQGAGLAALGDLPGGSVQSEANAISADGEAVVGSSRSASGSLGDEAFLWTPSTGMVGLGRLGGEGRTVANAVDSDGSIVVGTAAADIESSRPFQWTPAGGMEALPLLPGADANGEALGISQDGSTIVGWSADGDLPRTAVRCGRTPASRAWAHQHHSRAATCLPRPPARTARPSSVTRRRAARWTPGSGPRTAACARCRTCSRATSAWT